MRQSNVWNMICCVLHIWFNMFIYRRILVKHLWSISFSTVYTKQSYIYIETGSLVDDHSLITSIIQIRL